MIVDYAYEYGAVVADGVCRRIEFYAYDGEAKWTDCGVVEQASLGTQLKGEDVSTVLDGVYHPDHAWMPVLLARAGEALTEIRQEIPDAAGLVVAERQWHAQAYADLLKKISGVEPAVVVSADVDAKTAIDKFRNADSRWITAVKMVSEGWIFRASRSGCTHRRPAPRCSSGMLWAGLCAHPRTRSSTHACLSRRCRR
ncbi:hypothetical protein ABZX66_18380 [Micromonospora aurantiaca]|uniref:hypothetical protein n=1 Tax=Micromonospora aurantiaca (nom. illeg.) TaxID=47850 RepID=UPI0033A76770